MKTADPAFCIESPSGKHEDSEGCPGWCNWCSAQLANVNGTWQEVPFQTVSKTASLRNLSDGALKLLEARVNKEVSRRAQLRVNHELWRKLYG